MFKGTTDRAMVVAWLMKKMTIALSLSLQPTPSFESDYSITASTKK